MESKKILLIYPRLGSGDSIICDIPLSLLYAATHSVKAGYDVDILDLRAVGKGDWKLEIEKRLKGVCLVGMSVMTGTPIANALKLTKYIKSISSVPMVWGGPHCTVDPGRTLEESCIDYVVRGFGSETLCELVSHIADGKVRLDEIENLSFKRDGKVVHNPLRSHVELLPLEDIPYDLIDCNDSVYTRMNSSGGVFPIFTSIGCPHSCAFCMSPVQYSHIKKRWVAHSASDVVRHISDLVQKYRPECISVYDDDSFVDLQRMKDILEGIRLQGVNVRIDFRGARVDEIDRMDDDYLKLMEDVGVGHLQIGLESGSQKVLDIIKKRTTVDQIHRINRRLAKFKKLRPVYNIFCGVPGESIEDLRETMVMVQKLVKDNPNCLTGFLANYKPIPGSELYAKALELGLREPQTLSEWADYDSVESDFYFPWYTKRYNEYIRFYQVVSYFIDNKIEKEMASAGLKSKAIRLAAKIYRPIAMWRLRHNLIKPLPEHYILKLAFKLMASSSHD